MILSGQATFLGYVRLDDTATWFAFIDQFFSHGRALSLAADLDLQPAALDEPHQGGYPPGAFMLPGIGHWITGIDVGLDLPALHGGLRGGARALLLGSCSSRWCRARWLRAFVAFIAAQSALLFGYAAWGGIKELTAAFLLALGLAATARMLSAPRPGWREAPVAVAGAALIDTLRRRRRGLRTGRSCSPAP